MNRRRYHIIMIALGMALLAAIAAWPAAAGGQVTTKLSVSIVHIGADGKEQLLPADRAKPGEVLEYKLVLFNKGPGAVRELRPSLPVPKGTEYLPKTAKPDNVLASLDGQAYLPVPLTRTVIGPDKKPRQEEVPYREYRFLGWHLGVLEVEKEITVKARVRVLIDLPLEASKQ